MRTDLVNYDDEGNGSTSILVHKVNLQKQRCVGTYAIATNYIKKIKYNFKDKRQSNRWQHFIADELPSLVYKKLPTTTNNHQKENCLNHWVQGFVSMHIKQYIMLSNL